MQEGIEAKTSGSQSIFSRFDFMAGEKRKKRKKESNDVA
jgi:hypothetical protein